MNVLDRISLKLALGVIYLFLLIFYVMSQIMGMEIYFVSEGLTSWGGAYILVRLIGVFFIVHAGASLVFFKPNLILNLFHLVLLAVLCFGIGDYDHMAYAIKIGGKYEPITEYVPNNFLVNSLIVILAAIVLFNKPTIKELKKQVLTIVGAAVVVVVLTLLFVLHPIKTKDFSRESALAQTEIAKLVVPDQFKDLKGKQIIVFASPGCPSCQGALEMLSASYKGSRSPYNVYVYFIGQQDEKQSEQITYLYKLFGWSFDYEVVGRTKMFEMKKTGVVPVIWEIEDGNINGVWWGSTLTPGVLDRWMSDEKLTRKYVEKN